MPAPTLIAVLYTAVPQFVSFQFGLP